MKLSKHDRVVKFAHTKGYKVDENGNVISHIGNTLKPNFDRYGYPRVSITYKKNKEWVKVHRLAAYQKFKNKIFKDGIVVRHMNDNRSDASLDNLELGTYSDNMMDKAPEVRRLNVKYLKNIKHE